jgi:hypothetical protein
VLILLTGIRSEFVNYYYNLYLQLDERKVEMQYRILNNFDRYLIVSQKRADLEID